MFILLFLLNNRETEKQTFPTIYLKDSNYMPGFNSEGSPEARAHYERAQAELGAAESAQLLHVKRAEAFREMLSSKRKRI